MFFQQASNWRKPLHSHLLFVALCFGNFESNQWCPFGRNRGTGDWYTIHHHLPVVFKGVVKQTAPCSSTNQWEFGTSTWVKSCHIRFRLVCTLAKNQTYRLNTSYPNIHIYIYYIYIYNCIYIIKTVWMIIIPTTFLWVMSIPFVLDSEVLCHIHSLVNKPLINPNVMSFFFSYIRSHKGSKQQSSLIDSPVFVGLTLCFSPGWIPIDLAGKKKKKKKTCH